MWNIPDIYLAYSWNIQVQVSDWIEYSRYMISIWQYKLGIYTLDLYIWHMPDIRLLRNFGGHHVTLYVWNTYHIYLHQVSICHIYGVTWWPPIFSRSRISGICQIYRTSGHVSSICQIYSIYILTYYMNNTHNTSCHISSICQKYSIVLLVLEYSKHIP